MSPLNQSSPREGGTKEGGLVSSKISLVVWEVKINKNILCFYYFFFKKNKEAKSDKNFLKGGVCSTIAGFTSFCVHAGGTPTSLYLLPLRMKKEIYVGTRIIFFACLNLFKLPLYINLSMTNFETFKQSLILFPVALLGILIGYKLLKIIEEKLFYNILYTLIFITSTKLLYDYLI